MKTKVHNWLRIKLIITVVAVLAPLVSQAAVVTEEYKNGTNITHLFLWSNDPTNMTFDAIDLSDPDLDLWTSSAVGSGYLVVEGPEVDKNKGKFDITFSYTVAPFTFEYAEVLWDAAAKVWTRQDNGNITSNADGKKLKPTSLPSLSAAQILDIDTHFGLAPTAVPIPSSVVLMMSAIGFMGIASRSTKGSAVSEKG